MRRRGASSCPAPLRVVFRGCCDRITKPVARRKRQVRGAKRYRAKSLPSDYACVVTSDQRASKVRLVTAVRTVCFLGRAAAFIALAAQEPFDLRPELVRARDRPPRLERRFEPLDVFLDLRPLVDDPI